MATNFPSSLDNFTNPVSGNTLDSPSHSLQHSDANDAIEAIEAKLGVGASPAGSATAGQVLTASTGGTTTWSTPNRDGLTFISSSTFSGVASVSLPNDTFTTTYDNYMILFHTTAATSNETNLNMRLRAGGSDNTTTNYGFMIFRNGLNNVAYNQSNTPTLNTGVIATISNLNRASFVINVLLPKASFATSITVQGITSAGASYGSGFSHSGNAIFIATTSFDSATIWCAENMTGSYSVYGYNK